MERFTAAIDAFKSKGVEHIDDERAKVERTDSNRSEA
jgi:hypothetical protein